MEKIEDFTYGGQVYEAVPETDRNCTGCSFDSDHYACASAECHHDCNPYHKTGIIWIKKQKDFVEQPNLESKPLTTTKQEGVKYDSNKLQYSLIPPLALEALAKNLTAGLSKYPRDNWKYVENAEERYMDALYRHLEAHRKGELYDAESSVENMPHMAAVAVNAMFLLEFLLNKDINKQVKE